MTAERPIADSLDAPGAWLGIDTTSCAWSGLRADEACEGLALAGAMPPAGGWLVLHSDWTPFAAVRHVLANRPETFRRFLQAEIERWARAVKVSGAWLD